MPDSFPSDFVASLSETELHSFIERHLPAWQQACDANDSDLIVLHEASFGTSADELFLFACAIKYAARKGKHVHVAAGTGKAEHSPEVVLGSAALGSVYRETSAPNRSKPPKKPALKRTHKRKKL